MQRVAIIGTSGSGKTTLALAFSRITGAEYLDADRFYWLPNWHPRPRDVYREMLHAAISGPHWVSGGNYSSMREQVWRRCDTLIWLDYALPTVLAQLPRRTWRRLISRELCCNGNTENVRNLLSRDSLYLWVLSTHYQRKRRYRNLLAVAAADGKKVMVFKNSVQTARFLNEVRASVGKTSWAD